MKFITILSYFTAFISFFLFSLKFYFAFSYEDSLSQKVDRMNGIKKEWKFGKEFILFILSVSWIIGSLN